MCCVDRKQTGKTKIGEALTTVKQRAASCCGGRGGYKHLTSDSESGSFFLKVENRALPRNLVIWRRTLVYVIISRTEKEMND